VERLDAASAQVRRALAFVEFVEDQEPLLRAATESLAGFPGRLHALRRRLIRLGAATLIAAALLYAVLADPSGTRAILPRGLPYEVVHVGLLVLVVLLVAALVAQLRRYGRPG
jgi:hypothetical protein